MNRPVEPEWIPTQIEACDPLFSTRSIWEESGVQLRKLIGEIGAKYDRLLPMSSQAHRLLRQAEDEFKQWIPADHLVEGGSGESAITPRIAIFNPAETTSARQGLYVAYLFAADKSTVTLTLNQGVGEMAEHLGRAGARMVLAMQAATIRAALRPADIADLDLTFDLCTTAELSVDHEHANIVSRTYRLDSLSTESKMVADLQRFVQLYALALTAREMARRQGRHELITSARYPTAKKSPKPPAEPQIKPPAKPATVSPAKPQAEPMTASQAKSLAEPQTKPQAKPATGSPTKPPAEPQTKPLAEPVAASPTKPQAEPVAASQTKTVAASQTKTVAASPTKPQAEPATGSQTKPLAEPATASQAKPVAASQVKPPGEAAAKPQIKIQAEPVAALQIKPPTKRAARLAAKRAAKSHTKPLAEPVAEKPAGSVAVAEAASPQEQAPAEPAIALEVPAIDTKLGRKLPRALAGSMTRRGILAALVAAPLAYAAPRPTTAVSSRGPVPKVPLEARTTPVFTIDISQHDWKRRGGNLNWTDVRLAGIAGMCARATYGDPSGYQWPTYHFGSFARAAKTAGVGLRGGYHNLVRGDQPSINRQVDWLRRELDRYNANWAMLDVERYGELVKANMWPTWEDVLRFDDRWAEVDDRVLVGYIPPWNWSKHLGQPDLREFRGPLIASNYPRQANEDFKDLYQQIGGNDGRGWADYGNRTPEGWQYSSKAKVPGTSDQCDINAWRLTYEELKTLLIGPIQAG
jgi:GH25 family lysozyme M1 (1,4-beta-N-acetylmuramidase)